MGKQANGFLVVFSFLGLLGGVAGLGGCSHIDRRESSQAFINCVDIGVSIDVVAKNCAPPHTRSAVYMPEGYPMPYGDVVRYCAMSRFFCEPINLPELLHVSREMGPYGPYVSESIAEYIHFGALGVGDPQQNIKIFYDKSTGKVIGWISMGVDPVKKDEGR